MAFPPWKIKKSTLFPNYYLVDYENVHMKGLACIEGIEVPAGKESVDKHILAYMGYLMSLIDKNSKMFIVSADKGYDRVLRFMENSLQEWNKFLEKL